MLFQLKQVDSCYWHWFSMEWSSQVIQMLVHVLPLV